MASLFFALVSPLFALVRRSKLLVNMAVHRGDMDMEELVSLIEAASVFGLTMYLSAVTLVLGTLVWASRGAMPPR